MPYYHLEMWVEFYGPPGAGKTYTLKALHGRRGLSAKRVYVFVDRWLGVEMSKPGSLIRFVFLYGVLGVVGLVLHFKASTYLMKLCWVHKGSVRVKKLPYFAAMLGFYSLVGILGFTVYIDQGVLQACWSVIGEINLSPELRYQHLMQILKLACAQNRPSTVKFVHISESSGVIVDRVKSRGKSCQIYEHSEPMNTTEVKVKAAILIEDFRSISRLLTSELEAKSLGILNECIADCTRY